MTETEWLACTDPVKMLEFLRGKASDRKFRLYLCAGVRHIQHLLFSPDSVTAVDVGERFADGLAEEMERYEAEYQAEAKTFGCEFDESFWQRYSDHPRDDLPRLVEMGAFSASSLSGGPWEVNEADREQLMASASLAEACASYLPNRQDWYHRDIARVGWPGRWLVDCLFGNPFRPITIDPAWVAWHDGTVRKLAQAIYDERRFDDLPILADALEEAGCDNADILAHCRQPGEHVRGCWVVDLLLGKE
jgi:hypothetical protein